MNIETSNINKINSVNTYQCYIELEDKEVEVILIVSWDDTMAIDNRTYDIIETSEPLTDQEMKELDEYINGMAVS